MIIHIYGTKRKSRKPTSSTKKQKNKIMYDNRKKTPKANLEKKKPTNWLIGLVVVLALIYLGLEFTTSSLSKEKKGMADDDALVIVDENVKRTDQSPQKPQPIKARDIIIQITQKPVNDTVDWGKYFGFPDIIPEPDTIPFIPEPPSPEPPRRWAEEMPKFPGEADAWQKYLQNQLTYPKFCIELGIIGTVVVEFVVERDGSISNVKVLNPVYPDLDAEAVKVIKNSPKWIPGKQMGKPVRVFYQIPIKFTLH